MFSSKLSRLNNFSAYHPPKILIIRSLLHPKGEDYQEEYNENYSHFQYPAVYRVPNSVSEKPQMELYWLHNLMNILDMQVQDLNS
jgi:hypothetical protein